MHQPAGQQQAARHAKTQDHMAAEEGMQMHHAGHTYGNAITTSATLPRETANDTAHYFTLFVTHVEH